MAKKRKNRSVDNTDTPRAVDRMRPGSDAIEAQQIIKFALSQLGSQNGHHDFEKLCFQLARRRIYPNVLPATGPVSAGGDQGRDFESYAVGVVPIGERSSFFARATSEKVVFACSLEKNALKKIKAELKTAADSTEEVRRVVFFTTENVPVGRRHKLQQFATENHRLQLEVFDGEAISTLLVEPELFWIAEHFLSIPSNFALAMPKSDHKWYEDIVSNAPDETELTVSDFHDLKEAVRFAMADPAYHSDLPGLLRRLRAYESHAFVRIQRKAFYERFVASLRGLEAVGGFEEDLQKYISGTIESAVASELEDGAIIIAYSIGAKARGLLSLKMAILVEWRKSLLSRVSGLVAEQRNSPGRKCSLLSTLGFLELFRWIEAPDATPDARKAVAIWRQMMRVMRSAPLFPLERFGKLLSQLAGLTRGGEDFDQLVHETDKLLAARFGRHKLAEQAFQRGASYYEAGRTLEAMEELHKARVFSFTDERASDSMQFCIFLSKMYSEIGLHFAAKWYGLGAAFAALKLNDDRLRAWAYRGLTEAASSDHATGASMEFFLTANMFHFVSREFSMAGNERIKTFEWSRIDFYSLILTRAASYLDKSLHDYLKSTVLQGFGADEIYKESIPRLNEFFGASGFSSLVNKAKEEGIMPPFSDAGPTRHVAWEQLSARWFVEWKNDFETAQAAESFCATLQILLEDLRKVDMALLPSDVSLKIELYDGKLKIEDKSDNERVQLSVFLSRTALAEDGNPKMAIVVQGVATSALNLLSAMPQEQLLQLIEKRAKTGLLNKLFPYESYDKLFREFYLEQNFNAHYEHSCGVRVDLPLFVAETDPGLSGPVGLHPTYDKADSERQIGRRYKAFQSQLKYTLPRLTKDRAFLVAVAELRSKGWKDWHILQAVANVRMNFVLNSGPYRLSVDELKKAGKSLFDREEEPADPILPVELFSVPALKQALIFSQGATLKGLGFEPPQRTPNFSGLDRFLRRFNYWIDDIPHEEIFPSNEQPKDEPFSHER